jgi:hypothetical protein
MHAPVVIFAYKRLSHLKQCIDALRVNTLATVSDLIVFSDGPKRDSDREGVTAVRTYLKSVKGFRSTKIVEHETNLGLSQSIIRNVTAVVNEYGRIIVVEDDLVTSPYFLKFMNDALEKYDREEKVISVHGYVYPVKGVLPSLFFLRGADCWGWATWKRGWSLMETDGNALLDRIVSSDEQARFNFFGTYPYMEMLRDQIDGKNDSWAILWYASAFVKHKLTLYPGSSLVRNIGNDDSGTHSKTTSKFDVTVSLKEVDVMGTQVRVEDNGDAIREFSNYFRTLTGPVDRLKAMVKKIIFRK